MSEQRASFHAASAAPADSGLETPDNDALADLGVLLVHGIGQSHSSDTLSRFGEPLVKWIVDWVGEAKVEVLDAMLGVEAEDPATPAHTRLQISGPAQDSSGNQSTQWLVAESWWAESFLTPSFGDIAKWSATVVPWTAFYHFHRRLLRASAQFAAARDARPRRIKDILVSCCNVTLEYLAVLAALLLAPIVVVILAFLLLLGMFPIPSLRRLVARFQRGLALTIGDSYALLGPQIGSAAIYGRVNRELDWMTKRCRRVAVVAHSQGAAIAYRVVSRHRSGKCGLLITFGAGIRKLAQIRLLDQLNGSWVLWASMALIFFVIAALISRETLGAWQGLLLAVIIPTAWLLGGFLVGVVLGLVRTIWKSAAGRGKGWSEKQNVLVGLSMIVATTIMIAYWLPGASRVTTIWVTLLMSFSWGWLFFAYKQAGLGAKRIAVMELPEGGRAKPATEKPLPDSVRWIDLYAASDPVSNGPIFDDQTVDPVTLRSTVAGLESVAVHNRDSFLLDHTSYWQNAEDFIAEVVGALGAECGLRLTGILPLDKERLIVARHRRRWRVDWLRRARWFVLASIVAVWTWGDIESYTVVLLDAMLGLVRAAPWLGTLLGSVLPQTSVATTATVSVTLALGTFAALGLVRLGWLLWESKDRAVLVGRRGYPGPRAKPQEIWFHFTWVLMVSVGVALIAGWTAWPWWAYMLALFGVYVVSGGIAGGAGTFSYVGDILDTWPLLLKRNGLWTSQTEADWARKKRESMIALIEPVLTDAGKFVWQAGVELEGRSRSSETTICYETFQAGSLYDAAAWSRARVDRVSAATGDRNYLPLDAVLFGAGDASPVLQFWTRITERPEALPEQHAEAYLNRAHRKAAIKQYDEATADYDMVIDTPEASARDRAIALNQRAGLAQTAGEYGKAIADYTAVIKLTDAPTAEAANARLFRGVCYEAKGETDTAIADYTAVVETPDVATDQIANAYANRGWLAYRQGDTESFYKDSELAIEHNSDYAVIGFNTGLAALLTGHLERASELYSMYTKSCADPDILREVIQDIDDALKNHGKIEGSEELCEMLKARLANVIGNAVAGTATPINRE